MRKPSRGCNHFERSPHVGNRTNIEGATDTREEVARCGTKIAATRSSDQEVSVATEFQDNIPKCIWMTATQQRALDLIKKRYDAMSSVAPCARLPALKRAFDDHSTVCSRVQGTPDPESCRGSRSACSISSLRTKIRRDMGMGAGLSVGIWSRTTERQIAVVKSETRRLHF